MKSPEPAAPVLRRAITRWQAVGMSLNDVIGSGVYLLPAAAAALLGPASLLAVLLAGFSVFTALVFHSGAINIPDFPAGANGLLTLFNSLMMMKNLAVAGGFLSLAVVGAGAWSVDGYRGAKPAYA